MRIALAALVLLLVVCAAPAHAYRLEGTRWPKGTIPYYDASGLKYETATAVAAWNTSGARVKFKKVSRTRAQVIIRKSGVGCAGYATIGYPGRGRRASVEIARCADQRLGVEVMTHELGHILGLGHKPRKCALMTSLVREKCGFADDEQYFCRALEPDDLAGAIKRYGGRAKPLGPLQCDLFGAPPALAALTFSPEGELVARLPAQPQPVVPTSKPGPLQAVRTARVPRACPADPAGVLATSETVSVIKRWDVDADLYVSFGNGGRACFLAGLVDRFGRTGPITAQLIDAPAYPPEAAFVSNVDGRTATLTDITRTADEIVAWSWDFGDPASGAANSGSGKVVGHTYSSPGDYTARLTVTTAGGVSASTTREFSFSE